MRRSVVVVVPIILAAGAGRRMGKNKALVEWAGRTFLEIILDGLAAADLRTGQPIVVLGAEAERVRERHPDADVQWVVNNRWKTSDMSTSLLCGYQWLRAGEQHALVWPVDCPHDNSSIIDKILEQIEHKDPVINVIPSYQNKAGHPVLVSRSTLDSLAGHRSLREAIRCAGALEIEVDSPEILRNINSLKSNRYD